MNISLIKGSFKTNDALELATRLVGVKIKFHEEMIRNGHNEEDIKMREARIRQLQQELRLARAYIVERGETVTIEAEIRIG